MSEYMSGYKSEYKSPWIGRGASHTHRGIIRDSVYGHWVSRSTVDRSVLPCLLGQLVGQTHWGLSVGLVLK